MTGQLNISVEDRYFCLFLNYHVLFNTLAVTQLWTRH